jgi:hypothetical protein
VVKTPPFHGGNRGSSPLRVIPQIAGYGRLAQLGEHLPYKQRVGGSIPSTSTINFSSKDTQVSIEIVLGKHYYRGVEQPGSSSGS